MNVRQRTEGSGWRVTIRGMNRDRIEGLWKQLSGSLREGWGVMTGDRIDVIAGRCEHLMGRAQVRLALRKEETGRKPSDLRRQDWNPTAGP
jgi:uncharacterized protein YjbJ (UPF0337 family)